MKILITGVTGFIGQNLLPKLNAVDQIFVVSRKFVKGLPAHISVIEADLNEPADLFERLKSIRPDVCVHLAWEGIPDYGFDISRRNLCQASALWRHLVEECGCSKIVATGSCWEYGKSFGVCKEEDDVQINSYFTWAKHALADFGRLLAAKHSISFIWMRLFYVYGPGQREASLIPMMANALNKNERPIVKTPHNANDFIHVDDIADALTSAARNNVPSGTYNLGSGKSVPVWKVCEDLERAMGRKPVCALQLRDENVKPTADFWADISKSGSVLGWAPRINIKEGISL